MRVRRVAACFFLGCRPVAAVSAAVLGSAAAEGVRGANTPEPQICPEVSALTYGKDWEDRPRRQRQRRIRWHRA